MNNSLKVVPLSWMERSFVLFDGNEEIGRLEFEHPMSTRARAAFAARQWTFERNGILKPVLTVRVPGEEAVVLTTPITLGEGCSVTLDGRKWRWKTTSILRSELAWTRDDDGASIRYRQKMNGFAVEQFIEIAADDVPAETLHLLLVLGAYLVVQAYTDTAAVTAVLLATAAVG